MSSTFSGVSLPHAKYEVQTKPIVQKARLISAKMKLQTTTEVDYIIPIICLCTAAEKTNIIALIGTFATLILDGTEYTNCVIQSYKSKEISPIYHEVNLTFWKDTSL